MSATNSANCLTPVLDEGTLREGTPLPVTTGSMSREGGSGVRTNDLEKPSSQTSSEKRRKSRRARLIQRAESLNPSLTLENSGSVARDHLALERTFLAYIRTSLGCSTMGVALVQLFSLATANTTPHLRKVGNVLGSIIVIMGFVVLCIGVTRYFRVQKVLLDGKYLPAGFVIWLMGLTLSALVVVIFGIVISIAVR